MSYNSAVTIVRNVADSALSLAGVADGKADTALSTAQSADSKATFAQDRIQRFVGSANNYYDTQPLAGQLTASKSNPIMAKLTSNKTWTYTLSNLTGATPAYSFTEGTASDLIKIVNVGQQYTLTLVLSNGAETANSTYVVQPAEAIVAFYNPGGNFGTGEWVFAPSLL
jgi:hypothetical protein